MIIITLNPTRLDKLALKPISGINNVKSLPTNRGFQFQKDKPMTMHNYPLTKKTKYQIYGYKKDKLTGIKRPHWIKAEIATGKHLTPQAVGLDGFYDVQALSQVGLISPKKERSIDFSQIPESKMDKNDTFIYSKNIISNRGLIEQNVLRK